MIILKSNHYEPPQILRRGRGWRFLRKRRGREKFENLLGMGDVLRNAKFETGFIKRFFFCRGMIDETLFFAFCY